MRREHLSLGAVLLLMSLALGACGSAPTTQAPTTAPAGSVATTAPVATSDTTGGATSGATMEATSGTMAGATSGATMEATSGTMAGATSGATMEATSGTMAGATSGATMEATSGTMMSATSGATMEATSGTMMSATTGATTGTTGGAVPAGKIAILLPDTKTARYESQDLPNFKAKLQALGFDVDANLIYSNANQDASTQQQQAEAALTNGAKVLVLDPVDSDSAAVIADNAKSKNVPVISYDRLIKGSDGVTAYISFDNEQVGKLQGQSLLEALSGKTGASIVMINGSPTDNNASLFKAGAHSVLDTKVTVAKEYDTPDWSPDKAQDEMTQALTALGNKVDGVLAANDGTASGAIAAMKAAGVNPLPPVTGQDAELAGIQRILVGEQYMTVYKAIKPEAEAAAQLAFTLLSGQQPEASMLNGKVANGKLDVPSILLTPIAVTKANINDTVIKDGFWKASDICTSDYASACTAAGIK